MEAFPGEKIVYDIAWTLKITTAIYQIYIHHIKHIISIFSNFLINCKTVRRDIFKSVPFESTFSIPYLNIHRITFIQTDIRTKEKN